MIGNGTSEHNTCLPTSADATGDTRPHSPQSPPAVPVTTGCHPSAKAAYYSDRERRPVVLAPDLDAIPAELRKLPQWVGWRLDWRDKGWSKVPVHLGHATLQGYPKARSNDPRTWTIWQTVLDAWERRTRGLAYYQFDGVGFVFKAGGGLFGADLDDCRDPNTGELTPLATRIVAEFATYTEVSPSGTGLKLIGYGELPGGRGRKLKLPDGRELEVYDRGRFFCLTGKRLDGTPATVSQCGDVLARLLAEFTPAKPERVKATRGASGGAGVVPVVAASEKVRRARGYLATIPGAVSGQRGHDRTFYAACVTKRFGLAPDEGFPLLAEWNAKCEPPWDDASLRKKLDDVANKTDVVFGEWLTDARRQAQPDPAAVADPDNDEPVWSFDEMIQAQAAKFDTDRKCPTPYYVHVSGKPGTEKAGMHRVLHRGCGAWDCQACNPRRAAEEYTHLMECIRPAEDGKPDQPAVYVAVIPPERWPAVSRGLGRKGGSYGKTLTLCRGGEAVPDDAPAVDVRLSLSTPTPTNANSDTRAVAHYVLAQLPAGVEPPVGFAQVDHLEAAKLTRSALQNVPTWNPDERPGSRYRPLSHSADWLPPTPEPSDWERRAKSAFAPNVVVDTARDCGLPATLVYSPHPRSQGKSAEFSGPPLLAWLFGELIAKRDMPTYPFEVVTAFERWLPVLSLDLQPGPKVCEVIRERLWAGPGPDTPDDLRRAAALDAEDAEMERSWRATVMHYRANPKEAALLPPGLLRDLLVSCKVLAC